MFTIADGRDRLYQWDSDVKLLVSEEIASGIDEAHFTAKYSRECLTVKVVHTDTEAYVMVPNILLQKSYDIVVYAFCCTDKVTKHIQEIPVEAKPKPADYVYTETEVLAYWTLEKRLSDLEQSGGATDEQIARAVAAYLAKNPISGVPPGGKTGQYLRKQSDADGDAVWSDLEIPEQYGLVTYDQNKTITIT